MNQSWIVSGTRIVHTIKKEKALSIKPGCAISCKTYPGLGERDHMEKSVRPHMDKTVLTVVTSGHCGMWGEEKAPVAMDPSV